MSDIDDNNLDTTHSTATTTTTTTTTSLDDALDDIVGDVDADADNDNLDDIDIDNNTATENSTTIISDDEAEVEVDADADADGDMVDESASNDVDQQDNSNSAAAASTTEGVANENENGDVASTAVTDDTTTAATTIDGGQGEEGDDDDAGGAGDAASVPDEIKQALNDILDTEAASGLTFNVVKKKLNKLFDKSLIKSLKSSIKAYVTFEVTRRTQQTAELPDIGVTEEAATSAYVDEDDEVDQAEIQQDEEGDSDYDDKHRSKKKRRRIKRKRGRRDDSDTEAGTTSSKRKTEVQGPKRPKTAREIFMKRESHTIRSSSGLTADDSVSVARIAGERWSQMDEEQRQSYVNEAAEDQARYETEMEQIKERDPALYAELISKKKTKGRQRKKAADGSDDEEAAAPKTGVDAIMEQLKPRRGGRGGFAEDDAAVDEVARDLVSQMKDAYNKDIQAIQSKKPAVHKLLLLDRVDNLCSNVGVWKILKDDDILRVMRDWLDTSNNGEIPNIRLRTTLYELLDKNEINISDLEGSEGFAAVGSTLSEHLMSLWAHKDETASNKKLLRKILERWMRNALSSSGDEPVQMSYKDLADAENLKREEIRKRHAELKKQRGVLAPEIVKQKFPQRAFFDYSVRPESDIQVPDAAEMREDDRDNAESKRTMMHKKLAMKQRHANAKAGKPNYKVDMSGRRIGA
jgi:hypothetical protein